VRGKVSNKNTINNNGDEKKVRGESKTGRVEHTPYLKEIFVLF
jgi:hypothetical protein